MENGEGGFSNNNNNNNGSRTHNISNSSNLSWDIWELGTSRFDWTNSFNEDTTTTTTANALMFSHPSNNNAHHHHHHHHASLYGGSTHMHPDPHLTCLKLGKRHYFEDGTPFEERHLAGFQIGGKRGRLYTGGGTGGDSGGFLPSSSSSAVMRVGPVVAVPRCQVEGCHVALVNAKDYHRRHKVCEMHSKAPKVVVLGIEQRFCQQCSRFHVVSEFDDSKRSCRRRLAGHNERRRKSTSEPIAKNPSHETKLLGERFPCISGSTGRALSLLSSKTASWVSSADISSRSSAALRELIAENRAAVLSRQLFFNRDCHNITMNDMGGTQPEILPHVSHQHQMFPEPSEWDRLREAGAHVTLDLMQASSPAFGFLSGRTKSKEEEEEECCELWKSLEGTQVV